MNDKRQVEQGKKVSLEKIYKEIQDVKKEIQNINEDIKSDSEKQYMRSKYYLGFALSMAIIVLGITIFSNAVSSTSWQVVLASLCWLMGLLWLMQVAAGLKKIKNWGK